MYRSSWPLATKKVAFSLAGTNPNGDLGSGEILQGLLSISGAEYQREVSGPGGLAWALQVHTGVALRLARELSPPRLAEAVGNFGGPGVETLRMAFKIALREANAYTVRRLYANEIDQRLLADIRVEMLARNLHPRTHPSFARTVKRGLVSAAKLAADT